MKNTKATQKQAPKPKSEQICQASEKHLKESGGDHVPDLPSTGGKSSAKKKT